MCTRTIFGSFNVKHKISVEIDFDDVVAAADIEECELILLTFKERPRGNVDAVGSLSVGDIKGKIGANSYYRVKMCSWNALYFPFLPTRIEAVDNDVCSPVACMILNGKFFVWSKLGLNRVNAISWVIDTECKHRRRDD